MSKNYLISLLIVSLGAGLAIYLWNYFMPQYACDHAWFILLYYMIFTAGLHIWLTKNADSRTFIMKFMGVTGIKMLVNLIIILVYGLNFKSKAIPFTLSFLLIYFLFTIFESRQLIREFKTKKENNV
jgi:hypothetical protein